MARNQLGRVKHRQEAAHKQAELEGNSRKAINAVQTLYLNVKPVMLLRDGCSAIRIPDPTLRGRLYGSKPHRIAHQVQ